MNHKPKIFLFIAVIVLVFLLILYGKMETIPETPKRVRIQMVADTLRYEMLPYPHQQQIYSLNVEITGHLDGKAYLCLRQENDDYSETIFLDRGKVDQIVRLEWTTTGCLMDYYPVDVKSGDLLVRYRFFGSKH